jgi:hypothetical protein
VRVCPIDKEGWDLVAIEVVFSWYFRKAQQGDRKRQYGNIIYPIVFISSIPFLVTDQYYKSHNTKISSKSCAQQTLGAKLF